jgi:hypothetical protein
VDRVLSEKPFMDEYGRPELRSKGGELAAGWHISRAAAGTALQVAGAAVLTAAVYGMAGLFAALVVVAAAMIVAGMLVEWGG